MYGVFDCEYIGVKKSACGVIFEWAFLLLTTDHQEVSCYHWYINYNMYDYNEDRWRNTLYFINKIGLYNRMILPSYNKGKDLSYVQEEVREICCFFGVTALYTKGNVPTDKLLIEKCKSDIPLFNLEDFSCEIFPSKIHSPEDEVRFFSKWVPIDIPSRNMCVRYPKKKKNKQIRDIDWNHTEWMTNNDEFLQ